jgi:hypothetical protein
MVLQKVIKKDITNVMALHMASVQSDHIPESNTYNGCMKPTTTSAKRNTMKFNIVREPRTAGNSIVLTG